MSISDELLKEEERKATVVTQCLSATDMLINKDAKDEAEILQLNLALANAIIQRTMYYVARPDVLRGLKR